MLNTHLSVLLCAGAQCTRGRNVLKIFRFVTKGEKSVIPDKNYFPSTYTERSNTLENGCENILKASSVPIKYISYCYGNARVYIMYRSNVFYRHLASYGSRVVIRYVYIEVLIGKKRLERERDTRKKKKKITLIYSGRVIDSARKIRKR